MLSVEEMQVSLGYCFQMCKDGETLNPKVLSNFVQKGFGIQVRYEWARRFLKKKKFSLKDTSSRQVGYEFHSDTLVSIAENWFKNNFDSYFKDTDPSKIMSLDFTYSSYRTARYTTWSPKGSKQPKKKKGHTRYTNCFVTACWANGKKTVKMYTYNPQFKTIAYWKKSLTPTGKQCNITDKKRRTHNRQMNFIKELNINPRNIKLLEDPTQTYVRESTELMKIWLEDSKEDIIDGTLILHDDGNAFNELPDDATFKNKSLSHIVYPPEVHELLSPNDNGWHGPAKKQWRARCTKRYIGKNDGIEGSLLLLQCIVNTKTKTIQKHFKSNLFIGEQNISQKKIEELIEGRSYKIYRSKYCIDAIQLYNTWKAGRRIPNTRNNTLLEGL